MQRGVSFWSRTTNLLHNTLLSRKDPRLVVYPELFLLQASSSYNSTVTMAGVSSGADLERLKSRAELTDKILADLQAKVAAVKQARIQEANAKEEERLGKEINQQLSEIAKLKKALALAEIGNGVRQIRMPTQAEVAAILAKITEGQGSAPDSGAQTPKTNGEVAPAAKAKEASAPVKNKKESGGKTKPADKPNAGGKKAKGEKGEAAKPKSPAAPSGGGGGGGDQADAPVDISRLDMRVGKIVEVDKHPDADSLYVEKVDLGEGRTRTIVSGLVKHVPLAGMKDRIAVFMCNLKPAKMRGVLSEGMIMCASSPDKVEILVPPTDAAIGDRVTVDEFPGTPDAQLNPKKKVWETLKPDVRTNADRVATYKGGAFKIEGKGIVVAPTLASAQIS